MVFSSLLFIFAFLVICYALYLCVPGVRAKNAVLLVFSLVFYAWGGPAFVLLLLGMTLICWLGGLLIDRFRPRRGLWLTLTLILSLGLLAYYKYTGFFLENLQALTGFPSVVPSITLPIGISFYTFQLISYVVDVYRGEVAAQKKYWLLLLYAALFHQCIAGPIIRYSDVNEELADRRILREDAARGVTRFACGLCKKALLANGCAAIISALVEAPAAYTGTPTEYLAGVSGAGILLSAVCFMLQIYLDFSAYSDMAIGMGLMIGFHYRENFNYPYISDSVTDFWRRWHMSLSYFFRDYVYIPLGGNRVGPARHIFNLFAVWFLTGLWHGASWNFVLWGLYYFVFLLIEKYLFRWKKQPHGVVRALRTVYTLVIVLFGWMLFYYTDMGMLVTAVKGLFLANGNRFWDPLVESQLLGNLFLLLVSVIACTPIVPTVGAWFERRRAAAGEGRTPALVTVYDAVTAVIPAVLVFLSVLALIGDSYNPFLYTRF